MPFHRRWLSTICFGVAYFGTGLPLQLMWLNKWTLVWLVAGVVLLGTLAWAERKWFYPERLRHHERLEWLRNLPRSPDGQHYYIDRAGWEKHFGS